MADESFRVGFVPGVTLSKWQRVWRERVPSIRLESFTVDPTVAVDSLWHGEADACFVRLPVAAEGLSVIPLYQEAAVVVVPKDHAVTAFDEVALADLDADEMLDASGHVPATIALVASGQGVVIVPQSLARLHARKEVTYRPVTDAAPTTVALVWPAERTTPLVEEFVGIVRGRTARSSRGTRADAPAADGTAPQKAAGGKARGTAGGAPAARRGGKAASTARSRRRRRR
ncbi:LysR family substrate-binding domain-containing protein [Microbacterium sp. STN6]|uniref:LysR family substrate-binding domain-containing protein n=1 Tax=Microbacterium sp. STN6 TaxID=2995588 RepID=UPI002260EFA7|nr:LysR family substrate-binding domain-containing protein [Microbacterium sp. STN6]MCX7523123.1 LysR family substrate-binding domain-containing protein [Microbacterium sp. STN6]